MSSPTLDLSPAWITRAPEIPRRFPRQTRRGARRRTMRVAHVLRKCNPAEWSGTETAVQRLVEGLRQHDVQSIVYCPEDHSPERNPMEDAGCELKRFRAVLPIWGISEEERQRRTAIGGNLLSFDLAEKLRNEPGISLFHTHTLGRLGAITSYVARRRGLCLVVTIHGGLMDLPDPVKKQFRRDNERGWDWGRALGFLLRSRQLEDRADALVTCNPREAALLRERYPGKRVAVQPHGVRVERYQTDHRNEAREAFPQISNREVLLAVGRLDGVKNQLWLVNEFPAVRRRHARALLVLAGSCSDEAYGRALRERIAELNLGGHVLLTGGLPSGDPRLIGLYQEAQVVLLPSVSETFGLVILEAWASGRPVITSRTSGASALVREGKNGWLFDLNNPGAFHAALDAALFHPDLAARLAQEGGRLTAAEYDTVALARKMRLLYEQVTKEKYALCNPA